MKYHSIFVILVFTISCAHKAVVNEKILPAKVRVDDKGISTGMPNYALSSEVLDVLNRSRAPASIMSDEELALELEKKKPSLRRLYFRTLYQQWQSLSSLSETTAQLKSCPQFHHDKIVMDEKMGLPVTYIMGPKPSENELPFYPEWALTLADERQETVVWYGKNSDLKKAFAHHGEKLHQEIKTLCEEGSSDSYFRLENIVTYKRQDFHFQKNDALKAFLKIPVFSTMLLLKSMQLNHGHIFTSNDLELIDEVNGFQLQNYIVELRKRRQQLVSGAY